MKKIYFPFIFIFFIFLCSFRVSASYLPPTLPDTSLIPNFLSNVAQYEVVNDSNTFLTSSDIEQVNLIVNGRSINSSIEYTYIDNATILTEMEFYTSNGVSVSKDDTYTVYGTSDVGPFMFVAKKDTGETLYTGYGNTYSSTLIGGTGLRESFPEFIVRDLGLSATNNINRVLDTIETAKNQNMIVYGNTLTESQKDFLSEYRYYFKLQTNVGWTVWVPNACSADTVVKPQSSNIYSLHGTFPHNSTYFLDPIIFTNDPSSVYFSGSGSGYGLKQQSNYVYGYSFAYCSSYFQAFDPLGYGFTIDMELPTQSAYNTYKNLSNDAVYIQPVDSVSNPNEGDVYNYTAITNNPPSYNRYVNNNYNYEGDTNYNNYPTYYNYEFPTYPTNNYDYATNIYNYYTTPNSGGGSIGSIDDPILPENIPLLSNLEYRFPFSIPFDLYKIAQGLNVPRETPYIDTVIVIPAVNYEWHIEYDLHRFDDIAQLFRLIELILFIGGLAIFSYQHFFGS